MEVGAVKMPCHITDGYPREEGERVFRRDPDPTDYSEVLDAPLERMEMLPPDAEQLAAQAQRAKDVDAAIQFYGSVARASSGSVSRKGAAGLHTSRPNEQMHEVFQPLLRAIGGQR